MTPPRDRKGWVRWAAAPGKLNLSLAVGPRRSDGKHEVVTVLQRIALADRLGVVPARATRVSGFAGDTIVTGALSAFARETGVIGGWWARIDKRLPLAAGLGGGSSDAAAALRLANTTIDRPLTSDRLREFAAELGADVPFFLESGPKLATGMGERLAPLDLPQDYWVLLVLPAGAHKESTAAVYRAFDERGGEHGWQERFARHAEALAGIGRARDLALLPPNDLTSSPLARELLERGAFRADVTGAGPAVYGLFSKRAAAVRAVAALRARGRVWLTVPAWYV